MASRVAAIVASGLLALTLAGCGNAPATQATDDAAASETEDATATTLPDDFDGDQYGDLGSGSAYLVTSAGSTEDGSLVDLKVNPSNAEAEVSLVTDGVADSTPTYVYVDGTLLLKKEMGTGSEAVTLTGDQLSDGQHAVEFVQYDNGEPSGTVTFYRVARYDVQ